MITETFSKGFQILASCSDRHTIDLGMVLPPSCDIRKTCYPGFGVSFLSYSVLKVQIKWKDINALFAIVKATGLFLYGPAIVCMFPEIRQQKAKVFPTCYMVFRIIEISLCGKRCWFYLGIMHMIIRAYLQAWDTIPMKGILAGVVWFNITRFKKLVR